MSARNWDKLRRQDRARKPLSNAQFRDLYPNRPKRRFKFKSRKYRAARGYQPVRPNYPANTTKPLVVENDFFIAAAIWQRRDGIWSCTKAAPILAWMTSCDTAKAKIELVKRGCRWQWLESKEIDRHSGLLQIRPAVRATLNTVAPRTETITGSSEPNAGTASRSAHLTVDQAPCSA